MYLILRLVTLLVFPTIFAVKREDLIIPPAIVRNASVHLGRCLHNYIGTDVIDKEIVTVITSEIAERVNLLVENVVSKKIPQNKASENLINFFCDTLEENLYFSIRSNIEECRKKVKKCTDIFHKSLYILNYEEDPESGEMKVKQILILAKKSDFNIGTNFGSSDELQLRYNKKSNIIFDSQSDEKPKVRSTTQPSIEINDESENKSTTSFDSLPNLKAEVGSNTQSNPKTKVGSQSIFNDDFSSLPTKKTKNRSINQPSIEINDGPQNKPNIGFDFVPDLKAEVGSSTQSNSKINVGSQSKSNDYFGSLPTQKTRNRSINQSSIEINDGTQNKPNISFDFVPDLKAEVGSNTQSNTKMNVGSKSKSNEYFGSLPTQKIRNKSIIQSSIEINDGFQSRSIIGDDSLLNCKPEVGSSTQSNTKMYIGSPSKSIVGFDPLPSSEAEVGSNSLSSIIISDGSQNNCCIENNVSKIQNVKKDFLNCLFTYVHQIPKIKALDKILKKEVKEKLDEEIHTLISEKISLREVSDNLITVICYTLERNNYFDLASDLDECLKEMQKCTVNFKVLLPKWKQKSNVQPTKQQLTEPKIERFFYTVGLEWQIGMCQDLGFKVTAINQHDPQNKKLKNPSKLMSNNVTDFYEALSYCITGYTTFGKDLKKKMAIFMKDKYNFENKKGEIVDKNEVYYAAEYLNTTIYLFWYKRWYFFSRHGSNQIDLHEPCLYLYTLDKHQFDVVLDVA